MLTIARLNWPFYLVAAFVFIAAVGGLVVVSSPMLHWLCALALAGAGYFLFGSLAVSFWIYDHSDLYRWGWLPRALGGNQFRRLIFCHSGFDETSQALRERLTGEWVVLDHFNREQMTEPSIRRARVLYPPTPGTLPCSASKWPVEDHSAEIVFGLLAIHELRSEAERTAWFREAARCLDQAGRVVLVEHPRDVANFVAFGPGFLHFHSPASWRRCWEGAGLRKVDEFRITPCVRVFVLIAS